MNSRELQTAYCPQTEQEYTLDNGESYGNGGIGFDTDYGQDFADFTRAHETQRVCSLGFVSTAQVEVE